MSTILTSSRHASAKLLLYKVDILPLHATSLLLHHAGISRGFAKTGTATQCFKLLQNEEVGKLQAPNVGNPNMKQENIDIRQFDREL